MTMPKNHLRLILKVMGARFKKNFGKSLSDRQKIDLELKIQKHFAEGQLVYQVNAAVTLDFFVLFSCRIMPEFNETFFYVSDAYCADNGAIRKKFYVLLKKLAKKAQKEGVVRRMVITISTEDKIMREHYLKKGKLTYVELHGETKNSLDILRGDSTLPEGMTFSLLKKSDISSLIKLDVQSHLNDPTSRMREILSRPNGKKLMRGFYLNVLKNKSCLVARKKRRIAGSIAWFVDKRNKNGLIASIFVAESFKGTGVSKLLYKKVLEEFNRKKLPHYIGSSTTDRVLSLARKMKRRPGNYAVLLDI